MKKKITYKGRIYKYDSEKALLQWVNGKAIVDSVGLSRENWADNPQYWVEVWHEELDQESKYLIAEFMKEFADID